MAAYKVEFVFFIADDDDDAVERKDNLLDELDNIDGITAYDVLDDGEDWNIECTALIECEPNGERDDDAVHKVMMNILPNETWDYHYIKGVDNGFYWQP